MIDNFPEWLKRTGSRVRRSSHIDRPWSATPALHGYFVAEVALPDGKEYLAHVYVSMRFELYAKVAKP